MTFESDFDSIVPSPNHGGPTGPIVALCFHDTEGGGTARNVGLFFANPKTGASTTGVFGDTDSCGCVSYGVTAWHSGAGSPWNGAIEGYEHVGYASWPRDEWLRHGAMLDRSARHFAKRCRELGIPPRKISPQQLATAVRTRNPADGGICSHYDITLAVPVPGGHTDPGPNFPWDVYIGLVQQHHAGGGTAPATPVPEEDIMATKQELEQVVAAQADRIISAVNAAKPAPPPDDLWMGTDAGEGKVYIVLPTRQKLHVPGSKNPDPAAAKAENDARIAALIAAGFDNRGVQDAALRQLPELPFSVVAAA